MCNNKPSFDILKFSLAVKLRGHKQRELNDMFIHFFCLCPLGLTIKLNFNISKVAYFRHFAVRVFPNEGIDLET